MIVTGMQQPSCSKSQQTAHMGRTLASSAIGIGVLDGGVEVPAATHHPAFSGGDLLTIGLEEELILVDPRTLQPAEAVETVLEWSADPRVQAEFRAAQVELVSPVCMTVGDLIRELAEARRHLVGALGGELRVIAAGTHPLVLGPVTVTDRPRYQLIARDHPWAVRRGLPSGLHVHVGLGDADEALAVYNAARSYVPELAALAANSPFFEGADSGLASTRLKLVEDLSRAATPPVFATWHDFDAFVSWGAAGGLFPDLTHLWWDLRPRPDLGTLEFRFADAQTFVDHSAALVALCQSLISALRLRLRAHDVLPSHSTHVIAENRWRAVRDGLDAVLVDPDTGECEPVRSRIARLVLELEPYAAELGCIDELDEAWTMLSRNGAARQREVAGVRGIDGLTAWLADETER
jgi:carboxylate-amine ligase